jgi:hypothetical protein
LTIEDLIEYGNIIINSSDCWIWNRGLDGKGYGQLWLNGKCQRAHRVSYMLYHNVTLTPQEKLRHTCDTPRCINPNHLLIGSQQQNMADMIIRGRHWSTQKTHCKNGHQFDEENTYRYKERRSCKQCNREAALRYQHRKVK